MLLVLSLLGCAPPAVGCDFRNGSVNGPEDRCQERNGAQAVGFEAMCESLGGEAVDGGCPMEGVVAGCNLGDIGTGSVVDWYYSPQTVESVTAECSDGELVEP